MHRKHYLGITVILAAATLLANQSGSQELPEGHGMRSSAPQLRARVSPLHIPLRFEINAGQADPRAKFISRGSGYTLFLTSDEAVLALSKQASPRETRPSHSLMTAQSTPRRTPVEKSFRASSPAGADAVRMKLLGANSAVRVVGLEELPGKSNYFLGNDRKQWRTGVPNYAKVKYEGVYPGVDLVYYGNQQQLEYDFLVAPGADPREIRFCLSDVSGGPTPPQPPLRIDLNQDLVLPTRDGDVHLQKPRIYQTAKNGQTTPVGGRYSIGENQQVSFEIASYDRTKPLVIDPTVAFSTYLGGNGNDVGLGITEDSSGNVYVTGSTSSTNFPIANALQGALNGSENAFVTEISADGSTLLYSSYIGGSGFDSGSGIAVDSSGNAFVTGSTTSTDFPTVNPLQSTIGSTQPGTMNGFVFTLGPNGSSLTYSTYLGGSNQDSCSAIATDNFGRAYVTGQTSSFDFPTTSNAVQRFYQNGSAQPLGPYDAFLTVIQTVLTGKQSLVFSTFLGGSDTDFGRGISVDTSIGYDVYITGGTYSTDFPTLNGFQGSNATGTPLAFVTKLSQQGSGWVITYSTYLGGDLAEGDAIVAADRQFGVAGITSTNFPVLNAVQSSFGGGDAGTGGPLEDGFVAWFDTTQVGQASLLASTYFGGAGNDVVNGISGCCGLYWIVGTTDSSNLPISANALQPKIGGTTDAFVAHLSFGPTPTLFYSSYLGGSGLDQGQAIVGFQGHGPGSVYVTGGTCPTTSGTQCGTGSDNFPTANALQPALAGAQNAFVTEFAFNPNYALLPVAPINVALGASASATVTVQSIDELAVDTSDLTLEATAGGSFPAGLSWSFEPPRVQVLPNGTGSTALTVNASSLTTPGTYSLLVEPADTPQHTTPVTINVTATTAGVQAAIASFQSAGCIDSSGIANTLSTLLGAAQAQADAGHVLIAFATDTAGLILIQAQSGRHIATACTLNGTAVNPPLVLSNDVRSLMASLRLIGAANPILGYVVNSGDFGAPAVTVGLFDSSAHLVASATTDLTGFYYFANTASLTAGAHYSVQVTGFPRGFSSSTPPSQSFTWGGAPVALGDFTVN